jgi:hypothetical protein
MGDRAFLTDVARLKNFSPESDHELGKQATPEHQ